MTVTHRHGDLFSADAPALAQGVNCRGVMGAGIAVQFRKRYPTMFQAYVGLCGSGDLKPGDVFPWLDERTGRWVYNLATQAKPGRDARLDAVDAAVGRMVAHATAHDVPAVALPEIGCGIGGLDWDDVNLIVTRHATTSGVQIQAWHLPANAGRSRWWPRRRT